MPAFVLVIFLMGPTGPTTVEVYYETRNDCETTSALIAPADGVISTKCYGISATMSSQIEKGV